MKYLSGAHKMPLQGSLTIAHDENGVLDIQLGDEFRDMLAELCAYPGYIAKDENAHLAQQRKRLLQLLEASHLELLSNIANRSLGQGIVQFSNLPFESVLWSPAPGLPILSAKATSLSEHLLLAIGGLMGEPYGVANEGVRLVNELIPKPKALHLLTGEGSRHTLGLHYENAALRFIRPGRNLSPKGLLLTGVSEQKQNGPLTMVAIASKACALLDEQTYQLLREPCAHIRLPLRQRQKAGSEKLVGPAPVILGAKGREEVVAAFYGDMMVASNAKVKKALKKLEQALNTVAFGIAIRPGSMIYIANGPVLHGRAAFEPVFDEQGRAQRWLQRLFLCERIDAFDEFNALSDRVFELAF